MSADPTTRHACRAVDTASRRALVQMASQRSARGDMLGKLAAAEPADHCRPGDEARRFRGDPPQKRPVLATTRQFLGLNWNRAVVQQFPQ